MKTTVAEKHAAAGKGIRKSTFNALSGKSLWLSPVAVKVVGKFIVIFDDGNGGVFWTKEELKKASTADFYRRVVLFFGLWA